MKRNKRKMKEWRGEGVGVFMKGVGCTCVHEGGRVWVCVHEGGRVSVCS